MIAFTPSSGAPAAQVRLIGQHGAVAVGIAGGELQAAVHAADLRRTRRHLRHA
jgi:hypothetical protein